VGLSPRRTYTQATKGPNIERRSGVLLHAAPEPRPARTPPTPRSPRASFNVGCRTRRTRQKNGNLEIHPPLTFPENAHRITTEAQGPTASGERASPAKAKYVDICALDPPPPITDTHLPTQDLRPADANSIRTRCLSGSTRTRIRFEGSVVGPLLTARALPLPGGGRAASTMLSSRLLAI
jgi:hypothetical protein